MKSNEIEAGRVYRVEYFGFRDAMVTATHQQYAGGSDGVNIRVLEDVPIPGDEVLLDGSEVLISASQVHRLATT